MKIRGLNHNNTTECPSQLMKINAYNEHHEINSRENAARDFLRPPAPETARQLRKP
jgi:hypothetical protein